MFNPSQLLLLAKKESLVDREDFLDCPVPNEEITIGKVKKVLHDFPDYMIDSLDK